MENDNLNKLWELQRPVGTTLDPKALIAKAKQQRNRQYISIAVMAATVLTLIIYGFYVAFKQWNTFNLGLILMVSSLSIRIILEFVSLVKKENKLISMPQKAYHRYLKKYYKMRLILNFVITPLCIITYTFGFYLLLPYFKEYFSHGFYIYLVISGFVSILGISIIIGYSIRKEKRCLHQLQRN